MKSRAPVLSRCWPATRSSKWSARRVTASMPWSCAQLLPDIVILDIRMPVLNGLGAARVLQQRLPTVKVVIFTMDDSPDHLEAAMNAGALGYLLKDASRAEVIQALQQVAAGGEALNAAVSARLCTAHGSNARPAAWRPANTSPHRSARSWGWWPTA